MCNGYNHEPGCKCGFGGEGNVGGGGRHLTFTKAQVEYAVTYRNSSVSNTLDSYVVPNARCPVCGVSVFFYQSPYGGRVFFDELGPPWPKHPCTDTSSAYLRDAINHTPIMQDKTMEAVKEAPRWQQDGWEAFHSDSVGRKYFYSGYGEFVCGSMVATGRPLTLHTTTLSYNLQKRFTELMIIKCVCKRADRYLCEVVEVFENSIIKLRFTAYSRVREQVLGPGWSTDRRSLYYDAFTELSKLALFFINTTNLPSSSFVLPTGERVLKPTDFYEDLHSLLARPTSSDIYSSTKRLTAKLRSLRSYVRLINEGNV